MSIQAHLQHACDIYRRSHTITSQRKTTARTLVASGIPCLIQPVSDAERVSILGAGQEEIYTALFDNDANIQENDEVEWTDESKTLVVNSLLKVYGRIGREPRVITATLTEQEV